MGANIQPSRIKAGLMTLTGTTSDGSTDVFKVVNHTGSTLGSVNTQGMFTINAITTDLISGSTGSSYTIVGGVDPKISIGLSDANARLDILATGSTKGFRLIDGTQGVGKALISDADGYGSWGDVIAGITGATNLGSGNGTIYNSLSNNNLQFKTLSGGTNVSLSTDGNYIGINASGGITTFTGLTDTPNNYVNGKYLMSSANTIVYVDAPSDTVSGATNLGSGDGQIYSGLSDKNLQFKTLSGGSNVILTTNSNYINISATGGIPERIYKDIEQTSHGFDVKDVIGWSGGSYNKAIADGSYDGEILGIVSKCYNANCFEITQAGYVTGLTSLTASTTYFLSDSVAGQITSIPPTNEGSIYKTVMVADTTTSAWVLPYVGYVITTGQTSSVEWGNIVGSISSQTDLQNELNDKLDVTTFNSYTGTTSSLSVFTISGNSSSTGFTVQHNLENQFVMVQIVQDFSPYATVFADIQRPNTSCVCVMFDNAPPTSTNYKVLITG